MPSIKDASTILLGLIKANLKIINDPTAKKIGYDSSSIVVPYLEGPPGIGKTAIVYTVAEKLGMDVEVVRLAEYEPSEAAGWNIPNEERTQMARIKPNWIPNGERPTIVFFDELPQAHTTCQNVAAQAMNERRVGPHMLPDNAIIVAAGNDPKHKAGTNFMPTHLRDRLDFIPCAAEVNDLCVYFTNKGVDSRIVSYLQWQPDNMSQFDKDAKSCPSPRSWERVSTILNAGLPDPLRDTCVAGQVGDKVAVDFSAYLRLVHDLPDMDKLIANPTDEKLAPVDFKGANGKGILYAIAASLAGRMNKANSANVLKYLKRVPHQEIAAFVVTNVVRRINPENGHKEDAATWPAIEEWLVTTGDSIVFDR